MINPAVVSISFPWLIINFIYFKALTVTRMHPLILSWTDRRLTVSCLYSVYLSLHSGQLFSVGSFKPSFQQCLKKAQPQCARSCSRAHSSCSFLRISSSYLHFSSSYFCFW
jgi:hypothetical protein